MNIHQIANLVVLMGALTWAPFAHPISRIGNAKVGDIALGFNTDIPAPFFEIHQIATSGLRLQTAPTLNSFPVFPALASSAFDVLNFDSAYPELKALRSKAEVAQYFRNFGSTWRPLEIRAGCPNEVAMIADGISQITVVRVWGSGKGIALIGSANSQTRAGMVHLLEAMKINSSACAWK